MSCEWAHATPARSGVLPPPPCSVTDDARALRALAAHARTLSVSVGTAQVAPSLRALFGGAVCQVPLLDMRRFHKLLAGASWMEEYGNPDEPGVWEGHLKTISPYQRLRGPCFQGTAEGKGRARDAVGARRR